MNNFEKVTFPFKTVQKIFLNSKDDIDNEFNDYKKSKCKFNLNGILKSSGEKLFKTICLKEAKIPNSFYCVNENNNVLSMFINNVQTNYIVPVADYNAYSFVNYWTTSNNGITLSYNYVNYKFTFTSTVSFSISSSSTILNVLGFVSNTNYNSSNNSIVSIYPVNFAKTQSLYIVLSPFDNLNISSGNNNIFEKIFLNNLVNGYFFYKNDTKYEIDDIPGDNIQIDIFDENMNYINFNNVNFEITLEIEQIEKVTKDLMTYQKFYGL